MFFPDLTTADWDVWRVRNAETCRFDGCLGTENHPSLPTPSNSFKKKKKVCHIEWSFKLDVTSTQVKTRLRHSGCSASPYLNLCVFFLLKNEPEGYSDPFNHCNLGWDEFMETVFGRNHYERGLNWRVKKAVLFQFFFFCSKLSLYLNLGSEREVMRKYNTFTSFKKVPYIHSCEPWKCFYFISPLL